MNVKRLLLSILIFLPFVLNAQGDGHTVTGRIVDPEGKPVGYVVVTIHTLDSVFVGAAVTDAEGRYGIPDAPDSYRISVQHLQYEAIEVDMNGREPADIVIAPKEIMIDDVVVRGDRPLVRVEGGILSYDMEQVAENKAVSNAYEAILEIPGIREENDRLILSGAGGLTVILNGRPTTMSYDQLVTLLKNTPVSRLESAEVMYSAPAKYHVRGAALNIVLVSGGSDKPRLQGEVGGRYSQSRYAGGGGWTSLLYTAPKISTDLMYNYSIYKSRSQEDMYSHHTLRDGSVHDIDQHTGNAYKGDSHYGRIGVDYMPDEENTLSFVYSMSLSCGAENEMYSKGNFSDSKSRYESDNTMHNFNLDYKSGIGLRVGADYTYYNAPSTQDYAETDVATGAQTSFMSRSRQRIDRFLFYGDQAHDLEKEWKLTYGGKFSFANDRSYQYYDNILGGGAYPSTRSTLEEYIYNFYAGFEKNFSEKLSLNASLTTEYYKLGGDDEWAFFPQLELSYMPSESSIWQLSFSSDNTYPGYWERQSTISYVDGYTEVHGNPYLKPEKSYMLNMQYILKSKYIFSIYYGCDPDYYGDEPYQDPDRLALISKTINWDYYQYAGLSANIPFKIGRWLDSRFYVSGSYGQDKCDQYYDLSFDNKSFSFFTSLNNTINVLADPEIKLEFMIFYQSKNTMGMYDTCDMFDINAGVKWVFAKEKAELRFRVSNIFRDSYKTKVRRLGQHLDNKYTWDTPVTLLTFSYKFGGYTEKYREEVDRSRFRQ